MTKKDFIKIINEEVSNFDFLSNDANRNEQEMLDLLGNHDLQKQFICDSLLNRKDKIKVIEVTDSRIGGNWDDDSYDEDSRTLTIEYAIKLQYVYDAQKEPLIFDLYFDSDGINISIGGWNDKGSYDVAPSGEAWFSWFDWRDIKVTMFSKDGDEIKFIAFEKAPEKIRTLFIREYTQDFIISQTMDIRTKEMNDKPQNTSYC